MDSADTGSWLTGPHVTTVLGVASRYGIVPVRAIDYRQTLTTLLVQTNRENG